MTRTWKTLLKGVYLTGDTWDNVVFCVPSVKTLKQILLILKNLGCGLKSSYTLLMYMMAW